MDRLLQNLLYLIILAMVSVAIIYASPTQINRVHGILLPTRALSAPTPISVNRIAVYTPENLPSTYQLIGLINTSIHYTTLSKTALIQDYRQSILKAKSLAAQHGANGIMLTPYLLGGAPTYTLDLQSIRAIKTKD